MPPTADSERPAACVFIGVTEYLTLAAAVAAAQPGDTIVIAHGTLPPTPPHGKYECGIQPIMELDEADAFRRL